MSSSSKVLEDFLQEHQSIQFIRLQWVDLSGVLRARFLPVARCKRIAAGSENVCLAQNSMIIPVSTAPRLFSLSDYHETWFLRPDWSSLRLCGYRAGHASVMCFMDQKDAQTRFDKCPRTLLVRTLEQFTKHWGASLLIGFEIEFVLLNRSKDVIEPLDRLNGYSRPAGLRAETLDLVEEVVDALRKSSVDIHHFHSEVQDQLEIALAPEPVLHAIDSLVLALDAIRTICLNRNVQATMTPRPTLEGPSNGLHLHLSVNQLKSSLADNFVAGVLNHMGALCAFGMANYDSYVRSASDASGAWIGFGTDNRDLPVRKIGDTHWEFRMLDTTSNPYLFVAVLLLAALDGLAESTELRWKDCQQFPNLLSEGKRIEHGLDTRMPSALSEALGHLRADSVLIRSIPEDLLKWYISVKDKEVEYFAKMTDEGRRLRFLQYF